ncbi:MAG: Asp-tRNA(Asn)/Glu-tRNA(Gln) amidotransferase subunit GatA [Patescibacteria group bacterium]|nr:Asp-tRNA(Asn)/Glu-tRNA(Gln) amidotransferase subunit GatA [Patescibacteria group bacterium]
MLNFKELNIPQIKESILNYGLEKFYNEYFQWLREADKNLKSFLFFTESLVQKLIQNLKKEDINLPLYGIPIAIKDNILVKGERCTAGSKILENYIAPYNATVVDKLIKAGAIIVGKTNLDEFAMGSSTENSAYQLTTNPYDKGRVPGGSSGGSAAAVGGGLVPLSLGSDTGGSIRQPASFCGIYGLKPTYGVVSRYGLIAMASSLDQIGPMANNLNDLILLFEIIKGKDNKDSTSVNFPKEKLKPLTTQKIGLPKEFFDELDSQIKNLIREKIKKLKLEIKEISLKHIKYSLHCYYLLMPAEVSSNLARYDGIRYGKRIKNDNFWQIYKLTRQKFLGEETKRRIIIGTFILSHGYYEAYYLKAQKLRKAIYEDFQRAFKEVDLIIAPTSPTLPFKIGEKTSDPLQMYLSDIFTIPVNLAGLPALNIPIGFIDHLPIGMQIIGNVFDEYKIFELAKLTISSQ